MKSKRITNCFKSERSQTRPKKMCISNKNLDIFHYSFYMIAFVLTMFVSTEFANAQTPQGSGYLVQPGQIGINVVPRERHEGALKIHNFDPNEELRLQFKVIELTQKDTGDWLPFDTDPCSLFDFYPGLDLTNHNSCRSWIKLEESEILVSPDSDGVINFTINTPYNVKSGFYGATIMAALVVRGVEADKVPMFIRTAVPVTANVRNANTTPNISIEDIGMEFIPSAEAKPGNVKLKMKIKNEGKTFSRIDPVIRVRGLIDNHWKLITTHKFGDMGIIPGIELNLESNIDKSLPDGKYQLDAVLYVDQRLRGSRSRFGKEIEFEGDPLISRPAYDVPLDLDPKEIIFSMKPGLKRPENLKIHAAIEERILVQPILGIPKAFEGIIDNNVKISDAMTCLDWLSIDTKNLTIENFRNRNLLINATFPEDALQYPNYYASLGLKVMYPDGQSAGTEWLNICIENENAIKNPEVICSSINLTANNELNSEYIIQASYKILAIHMFFQQK